MLIIGSNRALPNPHLAPANTEAQTGRPTIDTEL